MARLDRQMGDKAMVQAGGVGDQQGRRGGGRNIAVEQHRNAPQAGCQHRPGHGRQFTATDPAERLPRIAQGVAMEPHGGLHRRRLAGNAGVVDTDSIDGLTPESWDDGINVHLRPLALLANLSHPG